MVKKIVEQKIEQVNELASKFTSAKTIVAFDYPGLTVHDFMKLRDELRDGGCEVKVYKNNISRRAAIVSGYDSFASTLVGPKAVALSSEDTVLPAKIIYEFSKTHKQVVICSGVIEGKVADLGEVMALATIPSREGLLTQLAVGLYGPIRDIAVGLNMLTEKE